MEGQDHPSFSDVIDAIGMGPFQSRLALVCGVCWLCSGIGVMNIAFVSDDIADTFGLNSFTKGLVGSSVFVGMIFGAMIWSVVADKHGRRIACILSLACTVFMGLASALSPSAWMLIVCRTFVGFGIGGTLPVTNVLLAEFLPTTNRAALLCQVVGVFWACSSVGLALLGLLLSRALGPGQEEAMWRSMLGLPAVPGAIAIIAVWVLLPESPRFLSIVARHDEGVKIIEEVARVNGVTNVLGMELSQLTTEEERVRLRIESSSVHQTRNDGHPSTGGVVELFAEPTIRISTISIWAVWFFIQTSSYGVSFLLPKYFKAVTGDSNGGMYILSIVQGMLYAPGAFVALWVCTEDRLGRVGTLKFFSWMVVLLMLTMVWSSGVIPVFLTLSMATYFVTSVPVIVTFVITPELYSTKHRVVALASANIWARIGAMMAPILAETLYEKGPMWPLAAFGPLMALVAIFSGFIPFETAGRQMDVVSAEGGLVKPGRK